MYNVVGVRVRFLSLYQCFILSCFPHIGTHGGQLDTFLPVVSFQLCPFSTAMSLFSVAVVSISGYFRSFRTSLLCPLRKNRQPVPLPWVLGSHADGLLLRASRFLINHNPFLCDCCASAKSSCLPHADCYLTVLFMPLRFPGSCWPHCLHSAFPVEMNGEISAFLTGIWLIQHPMTQHHLLKDHSFSQ